MNDHSDIKAIEVKLRNATRQIHNLTAQVGYAKQVREYDSDRRKNLLAKYALPHIKAKLSATAAESEARANAAYQTELEQLACERQEAEKTIANWEAAFCTYEAARSLLSMAKETMRTLE